MTYVPLVETQQNILDVLFACGGTCLNLFSGHAACTDACSILPLNQSKIEFLLIGLPAQLLQIPDPSLLMPSNTIITSTPSARNLGVIFYSTLHV